MKFRPDVVLVRLGLTVCLCGFGLFLLIFYVGVPEETAPETKFPSKHLPNRKVRMLVLNNTTSRSNVIETQRQNRGLAGKHSTPALHVGQGAVNVTIVDERQRVLLYWMQAARDGTFSKDGVTLVRFDKHSNLGLPVLMKDYPVYRTPTVDTVTYLLQSNQQYLMAAVLTGLIKEIIWVWPKWDYRTHFAEYSLSVIQAGTITTRKGKRFCLCMFDSDSSENTCFYNSLSDSSSGVVHLDFQDCDVRHTVKYVELREDIAANYFQRRKDKFSDSKSETLLDVDVDFLYFMSAGESLVRAKVSHDVIDDLNSNLCRLLCPSSGDQETAMDRFISEFIDRVQSHKLKHKFVSNFTELYKNGMNFFQKENFRWLPYLCPVTADQTRLFISRFVRSVASLPIPQLAALRRTGFCLNPGRQSIRDLPEKKFTVCTGEVFMFNNQGNYVDPLEQRKRLRNFRDIVTEVCNFPVKLVTVCRSVRDGFTDRTLETMHEQLIIDVLRRRLSDTNVFYDTTMLGGKRGFRVTSIS
eukprot:XP_011430449.1 PREDICTED: uncharacterized protein LOC105330461 [Crassostrea gigas]